MGNLIVYLMIVTNQLYFLTKYLLKNNNTHVFTVALEHMGLMRLLFFSFFYVRDSLANSRNVFSLVIWNLNIEFFFELHNKLNSV